MKEYQDALTRGFTVIEPTGGYELNLLYVMCEHDFDVHRADTRKVKSFIRSFGAKAKTDALDAKSLALYGKERFEKLSLFTPQSKKSIRLFQLIQRRNDLKCMLAAEKNRTREVSDKMVKKSIKKVIKLFEAQIETITSEINEVITSDPTLSKKREVLKTIPGRCGCV